MVKQIFSFRTSLIFAVATVVCCGEVFCGGFASPVQAGTFEWGDLAGDDVAFFEVTEFSDEASPLYAPMPGTGGPMIRGNSLFLTPRGFGSQSGNNSVDTTDSTLTTTITAFPTLSLDKIEINELGDYTLGGLVGGQANAAIGGSFFWVILEIDSVPVSLTPQATNLTLATGSGANGGRYDRPGDDEASMIWSGSATIDLAGYLTSQQISGAVTSLSLIFDNTLQTSADNASTAFIKTKLITIETVMSAAAVTSSSVGAASSTSTTVPEPGAIQLLLLAMASLGFYRRK